jgi:predicted DNA-binding transcriptional regulator AlpA
VSATATATAHASTAPATSITGRDGGAGMNTDGMDDAAFLTSAELAKLLRVSAATVSRWRRERRGPPWLQVGRCVRYERAGVLAWVARQAECQTERPPVIVPPCEAPRPIRRRRDGRGVQRVRLPAAPRPGEPGPVPPQFRRLIETCEGY